ncbi:hypothetical protein LCGC14_2345610 [marine sediment metagenome]|uniref:Uncharacterized protein n=1 Tax=marine sediment metagenome TaxID=412755 RepID=A0A0F9CY79_9ZZZZ
MALDFGNQLFGDKNVLTKDQKKFVTSEENGGMTLIFPLGVARDLTLSALSIFGTLNVEKEKVRGFKFTVKLFNNYGAAVSFTYKIYAHGVLVIPPALPAIPINLNDKTQYTKNWFIGRDIAEPGDLIQLSIGGDFLGSAAGATEFTFLEFKVETIMERQYGFL